VIPEVFRYTSGIFSVQYFKWFVSEVHIIIKKKLKNAGILLEISVFDHIIVAHDVYYSIADVGTL
jgi:hypothetical protein